MGQLIWRLPASINACVDGDGWIISIDLNTSRWKVIAESEYSADYVSKKCRETFPNMTSSMSNHFARFGLDTK